MKIEILEFVKTPIGELCLRRRELLSQPGTIITEVTLDHEFLMSSYHTASEDALARLGIQWHGGRELSVLVGGLGLGYTAQAALDCSQTGRVDVIELLPEVISWLARDLIPLAGKLRQEPRFSVSRADFFRYLRRPAGQCYDVMLVDIDHAPDENLDPEKYREQINRIKRVYKHPTMRIGRLGMEKQADDWLRGTPGVYRFVKNAQGRILERLPDDETVMSK